MATSVRLIRRYVWLIDTIRRGGKMTLEEINRKWMEERGIRLGDEGGDTGAHVPQTSTGCGRYIRCGYSVQQV